MKRGLIAVLTMSCCTAMAQRGRPSTVVHYSTCADVQRAVDALPASGGAIDIPPGTIACYAPLVIDKSNITLTGAGSTTLFRLADHVNQPVIVVGSAAPVPSTTVRGVTVRDIAIDGNTANQDSECVQPGCPAGSLRANGITIRSAEDVRIERVAIRGARSGGLVTELVCRRITVTDLTSDSNYFDGVAFYQTEESEFRGLHMTANGATGVSTDIKFNKNTVQDVYIRDAGTVGIFMRDSSRNLFSNLHIEGSTQHGLFLAQVNTDTTTPATLNVFNGLRVESNGGAAMRVNDATCSGNVVSSALFIGNTGGCLSEASPGLTTTAAIVCR